MGKGNAARKAVEKAADPDRLLDGEDPRTRFVEDAAHWVSVYSELVMFKEKLVDSAGAALQVLTESEALQEVATTDLAVLSA